MSDSKQIDPNSKDLFFAYKQNTDKLFHGVMQSVPKYYQASTNVQQEFLQSCENITNSTLTLQKEYVYASGIAKNIPDNFIQLIQNVTEKIIKTMSIQNQILLTTIDTAQDGIKTFNDNVQSFTNLNKHILKSWMSVFSVKN